MQATGRGRQQAWVRRPPHALSGAPAFSRRRPPPHLPRRSLLRTSAARLASRPLAPGPSGLLPRSPCLRLAPEGFLPGREGFVFDQEAFLLEPQRSPSPQSLPSPRNHRLIFRPTIPPPPETIPASPRTEERDPAIALQDPKKRPDFRAIKPPARAGKLPLPAAEASISKTKPPRPASKPCRPSDKLDLCPAQLLHRNGRPSRRGGDPDRPREGLASHIQSRSRYAAHDAAFIQIGRFNQRSEVISSQWVKSSSNIRSRDSANSRPLMMALISRFIRSDW